jgi:Ca2+-binding EF-hand superfamily protein
MMRHILDAKQTERKLHRQRTALLPAHAHAHAGAQPKSSKGHTHVGQPHITAGHLEHYVSQKWETVQSEQDKVLRHVEFRRLDQDGSGTLTKQKVADALRARGLHCSKEDIEGFFKRVDLDGNGAIDEAEFRNFVSIIDVEDASSVPRDEELAQVISLYGDRFPESQLSDLRVEFNKMAQKIGHPHGMLSISEVEDLFISTQFMHESDVHDQQLVRKLFLLLSKTRHVSMVIRRGEGIVSKDSNGLPDPFCEVLVDGRCMACTTVKCKTLDPVWEEPLSFNVNTQAKTMKLAVFDSEHVGIGNSYKKYLGSVTFDLSTVAPVQEEWYTLEYEERLARERVSFSSCLFAPILSLSPLPACSSCPPVTGRVLLQHEIQGGVSKKQIDGSMLDAAELSFSDAVRILHYSSGPSAQPVKPTLFPFDPESYWKQTWDILVMLMLLFTTFAVPYNLAFLKETDKNEPLDSYQIFDLILDALFCVDILFSFCTAHVSKAVYVTDLKLIARHYLSKWFWIDAPGSIPLDKIVIYTTSSQDTGPALKALKFIRLLKILRVVKLLDKLKQLETKDRSGSLRVLLQIFRALLIMVFSAHFHGCMFILIRDQAMSGPEDMDNWMDQYDPDLRDEENEQRYVVCIYWALATVSTIGYGDVKPVYRYERVYAVFVVVTGVLLFAFAMGGITALLTSHEGVRLHFDDKLQLVSDYLTFRGADSILKRRIITHFGAAWRRSGELYEEMSLLDDCPRQLKKMVFEHLAGQAERKVPILTGLVPEKAAQIFLLLDPVHFLKDEICYRARELGGEMYFVVMGSVQLVGNKSLVFHSSSMCKSTVHKPQDLLKGRTAESGGAKPYFGEMSLFKEVCPFRTEEAKAMKVTETLCLTVQKLDQIREFCPEFCDRLHDFCVLSAAQFGINHFKLSTRDARASRGFSKINQMCIDMRKELLSRHQQIMQKKQKVGAVELDKGILLEDRDEVKFKVLKELNRLGQKEVRLIVLDKTLRTLVNHDPEGKLVQGNLVLSRTLVGKRKRKVDLAKKTFPISKIDTIETFPNEGPTNLYVRISWKLENQRPYDLEFQSADDKAHFLADLFQMTHDQGQSSNSKRAQIASGAPGKGLVGIYETAFLCDAQGKLVQGLLDWDDESSVWTKGCFSLLPDLQVLYVVDDVTSLIQSEPQCLGKFAVSDEDASKACVVLGPGTAHYRSADNTRGSKKVVCLFWVEVEADDERRPVYISFDSEREAAVVCSAIISEANVLRQQHGVFGRNTTPKVLNDTKQHHGPTEVLGPSTSVRKGQGLLPRALGELLKNAGLMEYSSHFTRARIDDAALALMSWEDFRSLEIPEGPEIKIWNALLKVGAVSESARPAGLSAGGGGGAGSGGGGGESELQRVMFELREMRWEMGRCRRDLLRVSEGAVMAGRLGGRDSWSRGLLTHDVAGGGRRWNGVADGWGGVDSLPPDQLPPYTGARTNL